MWNGFDSLLLLQFEWIPWKLLNKSFIRQYPIMMMENKKVISRSLIFLFLSLSVVYSLAYMKKSDLFKSDGNISSNDAQTWDLVNKSSTWSINLDESLTYSWSPTTSSSINLWDLYSSSGITISNNTSLGYSDGASVQLSSNTKSLPGTTEYFWVLDIVNILWQNPDITLQDARWNYFAYYPDGLDFKQTVQELWWNVYEMVTESEIIQNQLFGDRVSYINLSTFKDIRVIMVIEIDGEAWLIQIPADQYHNSKDYLRSIFIS